jgi:hypothetical protein
MGLPVYPRVKEKLHDQETPYSATTKKKFKTEPPAKEAMATVFWDWEGPLLWEFLPARTTVGNDKYWETFEKLREAIKRKRPERLTAGVRLLHNGARPHTSAQTAACLQE